MALSSDIDHGFRALRDVKSLLKAAPPSRLFMMPNMVRSTKPVGGWRADLIGLGLGAFAAAALPPIDLIPVLLICLPGLVWLVDTSPTMIAAARRGFWFSLGNNLVGLYWITEAILIESARYWWLVPLAVPALSALLALFVAIPCGISRLASPGWPRVALLCGAWVLFDIAREFVGTGFPWNPLGSVWAVPGGFGDVFIQLAAIVGVHGLTLMTLLICSTPALGRRFMAAGIVVLLLWATFGVLRLGGPIQDSSSDVGVVLVQGNVPEGEKTDRSTAALVFQNYLKLTRLGVTEALLTHRTIAVVWPETASPYLLDRDLNARAAIWASAQPAIAVLAGSVRFDNAGRPFNSLFAIVGATELGGVYDKWHLVPFGEFAPSWVPFSVQLVPGASFAFGTGPKTIDLLGLPPFGSLICYEAIYSGQIVDQTHRPAWLVNITNDAWFGNSSGPRQHLAAARLRAVEEGLPLLRAANTGITAGFDASGREIARLQSNIAATLVITLPDARPATPYARLGLLIPILLAVGVSSCGLRIARSSGHMAV